MSRNQIKHTLDVPVPVPVKRQSKLVQFSFFEEQETEDAKRLRKRQNFQKLITKEFVNSERIEFSEPYEDKKQKKSSKSLKDIAKEARLRYAEIEARRTKTQIIKQKKEVPDYFRQREEKIKKMKQIVQQQQQPKQENQRDWTEIIFTVILGIGMAYMWKEIIKNIYVYYNSWI